MRALETDADEQSESCPVLEAGPPGFEDGSGGPGHLRRAMVPFQARGRGAEANGHISAFHIPHQIGMSVVRKDSGILLGRDAANPRFRGGRKANISQGAEQCVEPQRYLIYVPQRKRSGGKRLLVAAGGVPGFQLVPFLRTPVFFFHPPML